MLDERLVDILATDAHHVDKRPPLLAEGRDAAATRVGEEAALHMVLTRPRGIVEDASPETLPRRPQRPPAPAKRGGLMRLLAGR
jgi:protein-tyrosine phosphatase